MLSSLFFAPVAQGPSVAFQLIQGRCHHVLIFLPPLELSSLLTPGAHIGTVLGVQVVSSGQIFQVGLCTASRLPRAHPAPMATVMDGDLTGLTGTILQIGI